MKLHNPIDIVVICVIDLLDQHYGHIHYLNVRKSI